MEESKEVDNSGAVYDNHNLREYWPTKTSGSWCDERIRRPTDSLVTCSAVQEAFQMDYFDSESSPRASKKNDVVDPSTSSEFGLWGKYASSKAVRRLDHTGAGPFSLGC